ncbi:hypothetical protein [Helicobacter cetorum]|uniref:Laminin subunit alpha-2 n=1 Tax=Helicobacter cetorum (strain ATCC BAA-540 / CCUG 52418 / MIT 99-5656) TaxID=1163745 RepID=I0EU68_HELCM|nr:hypothetical protein [Helicobacter cetorum]AFI06487.1 hypothetical protein HCD_07480 [Helicobacter cetorum MIT 99-5656]
MPKISNSYNPSLMMRDYHAQRVSPQTREENKEIQKSSEPSEASRLAKQAQDENLAIGTLQKRLKDLNQINKDTKELMAISKNYAHANEKDQNHFEHFKTRLNKALNSFHQDVGKDTTHLKTPNEVDMDNAKSLASFSKSIEHEKENIQNSLHQWKKQLAETNHLSKEYNTLDKARLNAQKFQDVHNTSKITPSRLQELLA